MSFDEIIAPKIAENSPNNQHPGSGNREDAMNSMLYSHIKGDSDKPHKNIEFKGLVVYKSLLSYEDFKNKYDQLFVEYCTKVSPISEGDVKQISTFNILETIVYIQELCACLPQPENTEDYFSKLKSMAVKPEPGKEAESLRENSTNPPLSKKSITQIERYPRAYMVIGKGMGIPSIQDIVTVQFPYNFDYSYGVISDTAEGATKL